MLDEVDRKLIAELMQNARSPLAEIARRTGIPRTTLAERLDKLEKRGIIKGYRIDLNPRKLGFKYAAFVLVKVRRGEAGRVKPGQVALAEKIVRDCRKKEGMPWIEEVHIVTGEYDLLLKVWARRWDELTNFLIQYMPSLSDVVHTYTMLVLVTVHDESGLPPLEIK